MSESKKNDVKKNEEKIISYRKTCEAVGTGLSHYILVADEKTK